MTTKKLLVFSAIMAVALGMTSHADAQEETQDVEVSLCLFYGQRT